MISQYDTDNVSTNHEDRGLAIMGCCEISSSSAKPSQIKQCVLALAGVAAQLPTINPIANIYKKDGALPNSSTCLARIGIVDWNGVRNSGG